MDPNPIDKKPTRDSDRRMDSKLTDKKPTQDSDRRTMSPNDQKAAKSKKINYTISTN